MGGYTASRRSCWLSAWYRPLKLGLFQFLEKCLVACLFLGQLLFH
jgi:hypothetical protein